MLRFQFSRISFPKASKYVLLVCTQSQTKRTDVCTLWTSSPQFKQNIQIQESQIMKIRACQATIDRKLKIIGEVTISNEDFLQGQQMTNKLIYQKDLQFYQLIQGRDIPVGQFHVQIYRNQQLSKSQFQKATKIRKQIISSNPQSARKQKSLEQQSQDSNQIDSDFQMKSQKSDQLKLQNDCSIKLFVHGGNNFYLGSSFSIQIQWCQKYCQSKLIKDKITPQWAQSLSLIGNSQKFIKINVIDQKNNILQWTKVSLKNIRKMYPYHLKIIFRQQYMGDRPQVYLSLMRQDLPMFSILDKQIRLIINYESQNFRNPLQYLVIQSKPKLQFPTFYEIDLRRYSSFQKLNKYIESFQIGDYNYENFIPLQTGRRSLVLFKTQLNRQFHLFLISIKNWTQLFSQQSTPQKKIKNMLIVQNRPHFEKVLRQIYYYNQIHSIGKITEIYSQRTLQQGNIKDNNTWRTLTKNYILRNNLLNTSIKNIQVIKTQIAHKGQQLLKLKTILNEVKLINSNLKQKQKSTLIRDGKNKKQKINAQNIKITQIQMILYEKQAQLDFKKKKNDQMNVRMEALNFIQQDTRQLDNQIVKNAKILQEQQQKIKLVQLMRKQIPKQKMLIYKLQTIFEQKQIDRQMNNLLKKQSQKLQALRKKKREDLERVYLLLKKKNQQQNSLKTKVQAAQRELIRLNQFYAKLTGL